MAAQDVVYRAGHFIATFLTPSHDGIWWELSQVPMQPKDTIDNVRQKQPTGTVKFHWLLNGFTR